MTGAYDVALWIALALAIALIGSGLHDYVRHQSRAVAAFW